MGISGGHFKKIKVLYIYFLSRIFHFVNISFNKGSSENHLDRFADQLVPLMCRLMRHMTTQDRNYLARGLITLPQLWALHQVAEHKTCSMHMLAQALGLKSSTVTGLVDQLVKLGLLKRFNSRTDRRVVLAEITPKGRKILEHLDAERHKSIIHMFQHVSQKERAAYLDIVEKILKALSAAQTRHDTVARSEMNRQSTPCRLGSFA
jgi:MarR family 2-MHQ and catechol resistance regulon transcriptional repressor